MGFISLGTQGIGQGPAAQASPGSWWEMQRLQPTPGPRSQDLHFHRIPGGSQF